MLQVGDEGKVLWLLAAMKGRSAYFSRGLVSWTEVMDQLENEVVGQSVTVVNAPIEWV